MPSFIVNGAVAYSNPCRAVKIIAKIIVIHNAYIACCFWPKTITWCAQVTEAPELNNKIVFKRGISHGFNVVKYAGGQIPPIAGLGLKLEWKNAQKNAKKNIISETINKITPIFNPCWTVFVCCPSYVPSLIISRHQENITNKIIQNPR